MEAGTSDTGVIGLPARGRRARPASLATTFAVALIALMVAACTGGGTTARLTPASATATTAARASTATAAAYATQIAGAVATNEAQATATANTMAAALAALLHQARIIYHAQVPGPGCDHGGAQWFATSPGAVACLSDRLQVTGSSAAYSVTGVSCLQLPSGTFPTHYIFSVDVDALQGSSEAAVGPDGSAGLVNLSQGAYVIGGGTAQSVAAGTLPLTGVTHVLIAVTAHETFYVINSTLVGTALGPRPPVQGFSLNVYAFGGSSTVQADFSNFTVSALP